MPGPARSNRLTIVLCVLLFVFIGSLPLLLEHLPPKRYSPVNKSGFEKLTTTIPALSGPTDQARIGALLKDPLSRIAHGQAFYPRYYPANLGEAGVLPQFSQVYDFDRISFTLIGPWNTFVVYPTSDPPNSFNTDAQVWVLGCHRAKYLEALIIILSDGKTTQVLQQTPLKTDCR